MQPQRITALRPDGSRLAVELDGRPWRVISVRAAVDAGLSDGVELDRHRARALARALRRERAEGVALRALARRDESRHALSTRLARAGVTPDTRREVLDRATDAGLLDDARYAAARAFALAERSGDLLILDDLRRRGIDEQCARAAVAALEPESARVRRLVATRGVSARTVRRLAARGFSEESLEGLVAQVETGALR